MAITFIGSATGTTSIASMPAHQAGDMLVFKALNRAAATVPTQPAGKSQIGSAAANTCAMLVWYKTATSNAETSGSVTNSTAMSVEVYRGNQALSIGNFLFTTGIAASVTYTTFTLQNPYAKSWVLGLAGHRSTNTTLETPPTGMTNRSDLVNTCEIASADTNGIVASWSTQSVAVGGTAAGWITCMVELIEDDPTISGVAATTTALATGTNSVTVDKPFGCQVGDWLVAEVLYACSTTGAASLPSGFSIPTNGQIAWDLNSLSSSYFAVRQVDGTEGANFTFNSTTAGTKLGAQVILSRCSGVGGADVAANQRTISTTTGNFPTVTTTVNGDLVFFGGLLNAAGSAAQWDNIMPAGVSMIARADDAGVPNQFATGYLIAGAAGAVAAKTVATPTLSPAADFKGITLALKGGMFSASLTEAGTAADAISETMAASVSVTAAASGTDTPTGTLAATAALTEAGAATDSPTGVAVETLVEAAAASDSPSQTMAAAATVTEAASGAATTSVIALATLAEAAAAADSPSGVALASLAEPGSATDALTPSMAAARSVSEAASASDTLTIFTVAVIAEAASALDALTTTAALLVTIAEAANAADILTGFVVGNTYVTPSYAIPRITNLDQLHRQINSLMALIAAAQPAYALALPAVGSVPDGQIFVASGVQYQAQGGVWVAI